MLQNNPSFLRLNSAAQSALSFSSSFRLRPLGCDNLLLPPLLVEALTTWLALPAGLLLSEVQFVLKPATFHRLNVCLSNLLLTVCHSPSAPPLPSVSAVFFFLCRLEFPQLLQFFHHFLGISTGGKQILFLFVFCLSRFLCGINQACSR